MIVKIISGGQTGADRGGLEAGKELGILTGGTAPKGYRTENGSDLFLKELGLVEHTSSSYPPRTVDNVRNSDGTIIFGNINSPGCKLTISTCIKFKKPYIINPTEQDFRNWIDKKFIRILNVAGNRENTNSGIQERVKQFLISSLLIK